MSSSFAKLKTPRPLLGGSPWYFTYGFTQRPLLCGENGTFVVVKFAKKLWIHVRRYIADTIFGSFLDLRCSDTFAQLTWEGIALCTVRAQPSFNGTWNLWRMVKLTWMICYLKWIAWSRKTRRFQKVVMIIPQSNQPPWKTCCFRPASWEPLILVLERTDAHQYLGRSASEKQGNSDNKYPMLTSDSGQYVRL